MPSPVSLSPCTATPSARPKPMPSPTLRPTRRTLATRPGPGLGPGSRPCSTRLYAASVPGPRLTPPPPPHPLLQPGLRLAICFRSTAPAGPASGRASRRVRRPSVHTLLERAVWPGSAPCPPLHSRGDSTPSRPVPGPSLVRTLRVTACPTDLASPAVVLTPAGPSPPIRRKIRRRRVDLSATRHPPAIRRHGLGRRQAGRFVQSGRTTFLPVPALWAFSTEGTLFFRIERSGPPAVDMTVSTPSGSRPGRQSPDSKPENFCLFSLAHSLKPTRLRVDRPPAPPLGPAPPLSVRAHVAPKQLRRIHTARCLRALRLSLPLAYRFSPGRAGDAFRSVPVPARWPATNPHARTGFSALP